MKIVNDETVLIIKKTIQGMDVLQKWSLFYWQQNVYEMKSEKFYEFLPIQK